MRDFGDFDRYVAKNKKRYAEIRGRLLAFRLKKRWFQAERPRGTESLEDSHSCPYEALEERRKV